MSEETAVVDEEQEAAEEEASLAPGRRVKYEYPEGMDDPDERKRWRRQQRKLHRAQAEAEGGEAADAAAPTRRRRRNASDGEDGQSRPKAISSKAAHHYSQPELIQLFADAGLELDWTMNGGHCFAITGSRIDPQELIRKYEHRWGLAPTNFKIEGVERLYLGPTPDNAVLTTTR